MLYMGFPSVSVTVPEMNFLLLQLPIRTRIKIRLRFFIIIKMFSFFGVCNLEVLSSGFKIRIRLTFGLQIRKDDGNPKGRCPIGRGSGLFLLVCIRATTRDRPYCSNICLFFCSKSYIIFDTLCIILNICRISLKLNSKSEYSGEVFSE